MHGTRNAIFMNQRKTLRKISALLSEVEAEFGTDAS
jgi:hypothetical protein